MLISDGYRDLNAELHRRKRQYGNKQREGRVGLVLELMRATGSQTVLDYGCGKGVLRQALGGCVHNYDPAVSEFSDEPPVCDLLVCIDVLEHVELECLDDVLQHAFSKARKATLFIVDTRPDPTKRLADGSNPHRIIESPEYWFPKLKRGKALKQWTGILPPEVGIACRLR